MSEKRTTKGRPYNINGGRLGLAQVVKRDAKAFYKRYTAGERISKTELNLLTAFGVFLYNEIKQQDEKL